MKHLKIYVLLGVAVAVVMILVYSFQDQLSTILGIDEKTEINVKHSLFRIIANKKDTHVIGNFTFADTQEFELKSEYASLYKNVTNTSKTAVVVPIFTHSAYNKYGFYAYYRGYCEACTTVNIDFSYPKKYEASQNAVKILSLLGYSLITDVDIDKNPNILSDYDTVIVLHNEYVTKKEFAAITHHPHVIYLYPNSLYAEIKTNYADNTITLIRGHGYPLANISNGFDWEFDNKKYERDMFCLNMTFYKIRNGHMLNCYPEHVIYKSANLLNTIKNLTS